MISKKEYFRLMKQLSKNTPHKGFEDEVLNKCNVERNRFEKGSIISEVRYAVGCMAIILTITGFGFKSFGSLNTSYVNIAHNSRAIASQFVSTANDYLSNN